MRLAAPGLFSALAQNAVVVTSTRLQAAVAYREFADRELAAGRQTWVRPAILSLPAWLFRCWQEARYRSPEISLLLSPVQEHLLWKRIVEQDQTESFDADAVARLASRAHRTLAEWQISPSSDEWPDRGDARDFRRWCARFHEVCRREHWIAASDLWRLLPDWIAHRLCAAEPLAFFHAHPMPPAFKSVVAALGPLASFNLFHEPAEPRICPGTGFDTAEAELAFAARWARIQVENGSDRSIAVVIPDAATRAPQIERAFRDLFYSGSCRALVEPRLARTGTPLAYHLFSSTPLNAQPLVAGALLLLEIARPRIPVSIAGAILRSSWLKGAASERSQRASADSQLRRSRELDVFFEDLQAAAGRAPTLAKIFQSVARRLDDSTELRPFSAWAEFIAALLSSLGWPGDVPLESPERRAFENWQDALSSLASLSLVSESVSFETALAELRMLLNTPFEAEDALLSPVQILAPSQITGLRFDAALVTGLSEDSWPPAHPGNPLLPISLQRQHQLPGSSPSLLRSERQLLLSRLFALAPEVLATWSGRPSASVRTFISEATKPSEFGSQLKPTWDSYKPALLDEIEDSHAPPYVFSETARGGTGIIKSQSLCPFRAFAEYRLASQSPDEGCLGFDARDRGGHLHSVLEFVWKKLGNSKNLKAVSNPKLAALVEEAAEQAVREAHPGSSGDSSFGKIVRAVELARLKEVTLDWLALERERLIPFSVETVEEDRTIDLAGLRLRLRLDRMDRLANGGLVLIDYKSGEQKRGKLDCPRPAEPQLLVYAACMGRDVEGVLFAQLKQRDVRPHGWTRSRHFNGRSVRTVDVLNQKWEDKMAEAGAEVERLARQFQSGYSAVDPKGDACSFCAQAAFCRVHERGREEGDEE